MRANSGRWEIHKTILACALYRLGHFLPRPLATMPAMVACMNKWLLYAS
jgi:hypothetical protein